MIKEFTSLWELSDYLKKVGNKDAKRVDIVYREENWNIVYSLDSRTYRTNTHEKYFTSAGGNSIYASSLDGSDICIRVDWYDWKIETIYLYE